MRVDRLADFVQRSSRDDLGNAFIAREGPPSDLSSPGAQLAPAAGSRFGVRLAWSF